MSVTYFKRFRMEIPLANLPVRPRLPRDHVWVPFHQGLITQHALVKFRCFEGELDSTVFPCLGDLDGCERLMHEICTRRGFLPEATWLIRNGTEYVGTVQGVADRRRLGMIQNLGIVPEARGRGLGTTLLLRALEGFGIAGFKRGMLEVTAENVRAVRLYRRIGFRRSKTLYKAVDIPIA